MLKNNSDVLFTSKQWKLVIVIVIAHQFDKKLTRQHFNNGQ